MKYYDGAVYTGQWENDNPNGRGTMVEPDGQIFKGIFKDGVFIKK